MYSAFKKRDSSLLKLFREKAALELCGREKTRWVRNVLSYSYPLNNIESVRRNLFFSPQMGMQRKKEVE